MTEKTKQAGRFGCIMCSFRSNDASVSAEHVDHHTLKEHEAAGIPVVLYEAPDAGPYKADWQDGPTRSSNSWRDMQLEALFEGIEDSLHDLERYVEDWRRGSRHAPNVCDYANQALPSILRRIGELRALITTSVKGES